MIGTIISKPVDQEQFRAAMKWCCNPSNGARLMEYHDRYEVAPRPAERKTKGGAEEEVQELPLEERVAALEKTVAALTKGEEKK